MQKPPPPNTLSPGYSRFCGIGSLEEFFETFCACQLGLHRKPCGILNTRHYYDKLMLFLEHATQEGFLKDALRSMMIIEQDPQELIRQFFAYQSPTVFRWV